MMERYMTLVVTLCLFGEGFALPMHPRFTTLPRGGEIVLLNHEIVLPCKASGSPQPKIINWLIDDKPVDFSTKFLRPGGDLRIARASRADGGYYQCVAKSQIGGVVSEKKKLIVAEFDRIERPSRESITQKINTFIAIHPPSVHCSPPPKYIWRKNDAILSESENIKITSNGTVFISNLDELAMGYYELEMVNTFLESKGVFQSKQIARRLDLKIYETDFSNKLDIVYVSQRQIAGEEKTKEVTLECFVNGVPTGTVVSVEWFKFDQMKVARPIPLSEKYKRIDGNRRLVINNPTYQYDNGVYQCAAYANNEMKDTEDVYLDVFAVPIFLLNPLPTIGYTDNKTNINCTTNGPPYWTQRWYRNGIPVEADGSNIIIHPNNTISINKLNWEDHGIFQCAAENYAGISFFPVEVKVNNISARIVNFFQDLYVGEDSVVEVPCIAVGAPKPKISWLFNGTSINTANDPQYGQLNNGSLIINGMTEKQNGYYICHANNIGNIDQREVKVWIVELTRFVRVPEQTTYARRGSNVYLPCKVDHDPNINYTRQWRYNDLVVTNPRYVVQYDGALLITFANDVDDNREFSCHIFSHGGNLTARTQLILVQLPMPPSAPRASEIQAYSMRLTWDVPADGGSALTGYNLFMKNFTDRYFSLLIKLPASQTSYVVPNLLAGSQHKFQVSAMNKYGVGDPSAETRTWYQTQALAPSKPPSEFRSISTATESVTLAWLKPPFESHNGELKGYYIAYRLSGLRDSIFTKIQVPDGERSTYKILGLPLFTRYDVKIAAYNVAGIGEWSAIIIVETMQGTPTAAPTNVSVSAINGSSVYVSFNTPSQTQWNGKLTRIVARTWPPGRPQDQDEFETDYDASSIYEQTFILSELRPDTEYILSVSVATTGGNSPGSDWVQFKTREGVPDAVRDLQISGIYSDAFTVSWRLPKITAGQLKGYYIKYRIFGGLGPWRWKTNVERATATGAVISGLVENTRYEVKVAAFTSQGDGTYMSASVTTIASPELPSAPTNLKAYVIWGNNMSLSFTPGDSGRAVILHYLIEYNNDTDYHINPRRADWRLIKNQTKILENPVNITHLRPSTTYRFRMRAYNRVGPSPYSNISKDITTSEGVPDKAPTHIYAEALERETLVIRWKPPPADSWNSGSIKYEFLIKLKGIEKLEERRKYPTVKLLDTTATSYIAHGLQKFSDYNITMRLFNDKGHGPWSKPVFVRTSEDYPASAPCCARIVDYETTEVTLTWGEVPKESRNGAIMGYKVYYQIKDMDKTELWKDFPGAKTFRGTISGLAGFTDYEFRLLAYTRVGGTLKGSPVIVKTKEGIPGKPRDIQFSQIEFAYTIVRWNSPSRPNGDVVRYEVKYRKKIEGSEWVIFQGMIQKYRNEAKVKGLVYNHWYVFQIRAQTAVGWGYPAEELVLISKERDLPDSPVVLPTPRTNVHTKSITLKWSPRFDGRSPIRSYNIEYNEEFSGWKRYYFGIPPYDGIDANLNELEILKLQPGTKYEFRVRSKNDVGSSTWSVKSKILTTNSDVQRGAPVDARVIMKTRTSLQIEWKPPLVVGVSGKLRGYKVKFKSVAGIQDYQEISVPPNKLGVIISDLYVFTAYEVAVGAFNEKGRGVWSPYYRWRTGEDRPLDPPSNVQFHVQGGKYIRITWKAPNLGSVRGYILGYKIQTVYNDRSKRKRRGLVPVCPTIPYVETHIAGPSDNEITLKNLRKYAWYSVTVRIYNNYQDGPSSRKLYFDTPKDIPGPPYILSSRVYMDQVDIDFERPCQPNGRIMRYKVVLSNAMTGDVIRTEYPVPERLKFSALAPDTSYVVKLFAETEMGYGQSADLPFKTYPFRERDPRPPGAPEPYKNSKGVLMLQWETGDTGNVAVDKFYLEYKTSDTGWEEYRTILAEEMRYDGSLVVYQVIGLNAGEVYRFRVKSQTRYGISAFSESSKPITAFRDFSSGPIYKEVWFIFVLVIVFLLICIIMGVVCYRCKNKKTKYEPTDPKYNFSSFEMAMVSNADDESQHQLLPPSRGGSGHASVASSKRTGKFNDTSSIVKSSIHDDDEDTEEEMRRRDKKYEEEESIANHYSKNPVHKTWQDSLDHKTKKQIMEDFRSPPEEKKPKRPAPEKQDRARGPRPGKRDTTLEKKLARSNPELAEPESQQRYATVNKPTTRRPGKRPIHQELARSQPDLNRDSPRQENPVSRAPSFLRATERNDSESESFQDVFDKEKTKRELAMDLDKKPPPFYPSAAPPPYDFNGAPPAYTPSESDDYHPDMDATVKGGGPTYSNYSKPRYSDNSDFSDYGRSNQFKYTPAKRDSRGYPPPERKSTSYDHGNEPPYTNFAPKGRYSMPPPPQDDEDDYDDDMDETGDMTLV